MMKVLLQKRFMKYALGIGMVFMLLTPVYMYFSHDVSILLAQYPHVRVEKDLSSRVEIKALKPRFWVSLRHISPFAKGAIVVSEDWAFYHHQGVDVEQIKVALGEMMEVKRFRGASTITQQMVKNVFLSDSRTLWRKVHEIILAQKVEDVLTKDRILEVYLNCIEYGPGIYGIQAAARHYFNKSPLELSPREGAFLAMLLPSPKIYAESFKRKKLTKFAQKRIKVILKKMRMAKIISLEEFELEEKKKFSWEN